MNHVASGTLEIVVRAVTDIEDEVVLKGATLTPARDHYVISSAQNRWTSRNGIPVEARETWGQEDPSQKSLSGLSYSAENASVFATSINGVVFKDGLYGEYGREGARWDVCPLLVTKKPIDDEGDPVVRFQGYLVIDRKTLRTDVTFKEKS